MRSTAIPDYSRAQTSRLGMLITDHNGDILVINPSFIRMTGYGARDCLGRNIFTALRYPVSPPPAGLDRVKPWKGRIALRKPDGPNLCLKLIIQPVTDAHGDLKLVYFLFAPVQGRAEFEFDAR